MFEAWSRVVGGVLAIAGLDGFLGNLSEFYQDADLEGAELRAFLAAWWAAHEEAPVLVADLMTLDALPSRVTESGRSGEDRGRAVRLGRLLSSLRDRVFRLDAPRTGEVGAQPPQGGHGHDHASRVRVTHAGISHSAARWRLVAGA
jgi:hypothetical protein